jgi:hypothetical protein
VRGLYFPEVLGRDLGWTRCMDGGHEKWLVPFGAADRTRQGRRGAVCMDVYGGMGV